MLKSQSPSLPPQHRHENHKSDSSLRRPNPLKDVENKISQSKLLWFPGSDDDSQSESTSNKKNRISKHPLLRFIDPNHNGNLDNNNKEELENKIKQENQNMNEKQLENLLSEMGNSIEIDDTFREKIENKYNITIEEPYPSKVSGIVQATSNVFGGPNQIVIENFEDVLQFDQLLYNSMQNAENNHHIPSKHHHMHITHDLKHENNNNNNNNKHTINKHNNKVNKQQSANNTKITKHAIDSVDGGNDMNTDDISLNENKNNENKNDIPFTTNDQNEILSFQSNKLICSTLHFHNYQCDLYFNDYSYFQPFGMLYHSLMLNNENNNENAKYIQTSEIDLADTFESQSKEPSINKIYHYITNVKDQQNGIAQMSQHILKHKFEKVFNEYFKTHVSKQPPLQYENDSEKKKDITDININDKTDNSNNVNGKQDETENESWTEAEMLKMIAEMLQQHVNGGRKVIDPYSQ